jgi:hypothetical protein
MGAMNKTWAVFAAVTVVVIAAVWLLPPVGLAAALIMLALLPPWGRTVVERAAVSFIVVLGLIAVVFPRAGSTPVTHLSAHVLITVLLLAFLALRAVPRLREVGLPRVDPVDVVSGLVGVITVVWLLSTYAGRSLQQVVASLFFAGWDNQGHFTTFANTYAVGSTTWHTSDGSIAWNQWYPSLHTTSWALGELAVRAETLSRQELVIQFTHWQALSFALCMAGLTWVAGDLAGRIAGPERRRLARVLGASAFGVFAILGSPTFLFNGGFTNFVMGVTVVVLVAYLSARSLRSARVFGWFLVPLGALVVIGLWTPLVLGIVPSGVVVAIALIRWRRLLGIAWLIGTALLGAFVAVTQTAAILGVEPGTTSADFAKNLGAVSSGMVPFNLALALASPVIVVLVLVMLARSGRWMLGVAVVGPVVGACLVALYFSFSADAAGITRLQSYYVLKPLDGALIAVVTVVAALAGVGVARVASSVSRPTAVISVLLAGVIALSLFGFVGTAPNGLGAGFFAAPAVQAGVERMKGINDPLIGTSIVGAASAADAYPQDVTMLFDGSGTLPNLWVSSLHGVMSKAQNAYYRDLPAFPYNDKTVAYMQLALRFQPTWTFATMWFRPSTGQMLNGVNDPRIIPVQFSVGQNAYCPECAP